MNHFIDFLREFDYFSSYPLDPAAPRIIEDPSYVVAALKHLQREDLSESFSPTCYKEIQPSINSEQSSQSLSDFLKRILSKEKLRRPQVEQALVNFMELERNMEKTLFQSVALIRKTLLKLGKIFASEGKINDEARIFMLTLDEVMQSLDDESINFDNTVSKRKDANSIWNIYSAPGVFTGSRFNITPLELTRPEGNSTCLYGIPVCKGRVRGNTIKIRSYKDFAHINKEHIPVIRNFSLNIAPFLMNAPCVILENVSLSGTDIALLRKLQVPAIGGFPGVMKFLENNESIEINGDTGELHFLS
jgi:phosphohistidine swiveling domain-containing protein